MPDIIRTTFKRTSDKSASPKTINIFTTRVTVAKQLRKMAVKEGYEITAAIDEIEDYDDAKDAMVTLRHFLPI